MQNCINQIFYEGGAWFCITPYKTKIFFSQREVFKLAPTLSILTPESLERVDTVRPAKDFISSTYIYLKFFKLFKKKINFLSKKT